MPLPTPFHPRTSALCTSLFYKEWAGYYTVRSYGTSHDREYHALRNAAGVIDVSPLYKYDVRGPDAAALLSRVTVRDIGTLAVGRVTYLCWCDDDGKIVDDGTVSRLGETHFRLTAAEPTYAWLLRFADPFDVEIDDTSERLGALAIQGPRSRDVLAQVVGADLGELRFFGLVHTQLAGADVVVTRTGYTGDLGYEVWVDREQALVVYDAIMAAGRDHRIVPAGMDAMDVTRIEAGFIMNGVDYFGANHCVVESRKSTPYELGLGWTVEVDRDHGFVGQAALRAEKSAGPAWHMVGVKIDWDEYEALFARYGLAPETPPGAWRTSVPMYDAQQQVGFATSGAFSPLLKGNYALASVRAGHHRIGTRLQIEVTAEHERHRVGAVVTKTPFFDPPRKRA